jgi:hypothetical protein
MGDDYNVIRTIIGRKAVCADTIQQRQGLAIGSYDKKTIID